MVGLRPRVSLVRPYSKVIDKILGKTTEITHLEFISKFPIKNLSFSDFQIFEIEILGSAIFTKVKKLKTTKLSFINDVMTGGGGKDQRFWDEST